MTYRPYIDDEVDERVGLYMARNSGNKKDIYEQGVQLMLNPHGKEYEWLRVIDKYAENTGLSRSDVLNQVIPQVIDNKGEAEIQFKERLGLD